MASISVSWNSWCQIYPLPSNMSKIRPSWLVHVFPPLIPKKPGQYKSMCGVSTLVPILAQILYTNYVKSGESTPNEISWSEFRNSESIHILLPYVMVMSPENHTSGSRFSTDLPSSESHCYIRLPNGSDIFNVDSSGGKNNSMGLPFIKPSYRLPLKSPWLLVQ